MSPSQEYERKLHPDDLPLLVQRAWPTDSDCHFRVRRNPRAPPLPPRTLLAEEEEDEEPSRALSALSLESESDKRYSPVYKYPSIGYCKETKNDYLYIWLISVFVRIWESDLVRALLAFDQLRGILQFIIAWNDLGNL